MIDFWSKLSPEQKARIKEKYKGKCLNCYGTGIVTQYNFDYDEIGGAFEEVKCPKCNGTGKNKEN